LNARRDRLLRCGDVAAQIAVADICSTAQVQTQQS
jgi:hypothetical protein